MKKAETAPREAERWTPDPQEGLSSRQVASRRETGHTNGNQSVPTRTVGQIVRSNVFTLFNFVILILGLAVLLVGAYKNLLFVLVMLLNLFIGIVQEIRTKRVIDKLSILSAAKVHVVRDGSVSPVPVDDVVLDDVLELTRGNQVAADCVVLSGSCEVNESLITGEPDAIPKGPGDTLLSGSFLMSGTCRARADRVGAESYVARISQDAKRHKKVKSEMMDSIMKIIRFVSIVIFPLGAVLFWGQMNIPGHSFQSAVVSTTAALVGMIPEGLVLLTSVVLAVSVIRLSKYQVMVQELTCIETLARVDTLCLDKTGTITQGTMEFRRLVPLEPRTREEAERALRALCGAQGEDDTPTFQALKAVYGGEAEKKPLLSVPFSSDKKWSGVTLDGGHSLLLGAPEMILRDRVSPLKPQLDALAQEGRVLLLAHAPESLAGGLPSGIEPLCLLLVQDAIRPDAKETLAFFREQGVTLKVISGDNPVTVSSIAKRVELTDADKYVDASTLKTEAELREAVDRCAVFGRVSPEQKKQMVQILKDQGHTVAMTGDGVNDVLALREADCSIAMASGSDAARNVSQLTLLDSNFASMPQVVFEGRRSINNLQRSASLFLVKTLYSILLALLFLVIPYPYPFEPIQLTLVSSLTIGFPSFVLALEPNKNRVTGNFLRTVISKSVPGAVTIVLSVVALCLLSPVLGVNWEELSTLCVLSAAFTGLMIIFRLCRPFTLVRKLLFGAIVLGLLLSVLILPWFFSLVPITGYLALCMLGTFVVDLGVFAVLNKAVKAKV